jgi:hypothetical protein
MINRATSMSIGQELRAVGQALEAFDIADFDLQRDGAGYLALGVPRNPVSELKTGHSANGRIWNALESAWQNLTGRSALDQSRPTPAREFCVYSLRRRDFSDWKPQGSSNATRSPPAFPIPRDLDRFCEWSARGSMANPAGCLKFENGVIGFLSNIVPTATCILRKNGKSPSSWSIGSKVFGSANRAPTSLNVN